MSPSAQSVKLKIICVKKEQKSADLDTFTIQTSLHVLYKYCMRIRFVAILKERGAASFQRRGGGGVGGKCPPK